MLDFLKNLDTTQMLMIGVLVFLMATGRINLAALIGSLLKPGTPTTPVPLPGPGPTPADPQVNWIKLLLDLLMKAKASGDVKGEEAALTLLKGCCDKPGPHPH